MFGKSKNYIISAKNIEPEHANQVGREAVAISELLAAGVNVPSTFVITTTAFDDFITAANLIDKIAASLHNVKPGDLASAQNASAEIEDVILTASFPSIVLSPLIQAYKSLSGFTDKYVTVKPSWVLDPTLIPKNKEQFTKLNIKGEASLLYAVKQAWIVLFTPEALLLRANNSYTAELSIAVEVQKMVQAEVSGTAVSADPVTLDPQIIEITALLGLKPPEEDFDLQPDIYKIDANDLRVLEKNISTQEFMVLRKGRARPDESPNMKVAISPDWRRKPKLADKHLEHIGQIIKHLAANYTHPIEIYWAIETGTIYILSINEITPIRLLIDNLDAHVSKIYGVKSALPDLAVNQVTKQELKTKMQRFKTDKAKISSLVHEVNTLASAPQKLEGIQQLKPINKDQFLTSLYLDVSSMDSNTLAEAKMFSGVYFDATEMVIRLKKLPEDLVNNKTEFNNLVESYAQEIASAARVVEPEPLLYSFSDIGLEERAKMDLEISDPNILDGSERFVVNPEAMLAEIMAVRKARLVYDAKNIRLIIPKLRTEQELVDIKKILTSQNVKRTSVLQLYAEVATPSFLYELEELDHNDIDGIVINYTKLGQAIIGRTVLIERDHKAIITAIKVMQERSKKRRLQTVIKVTNDLSLVKMLFEAQIAFSGLIFASSFTTEFSAAYAALEKIHRGEVVLRKPARGRKPKELFDRT